MNIIARLFVGNCLRAMVFSFQVLFTILIVFISIRNVNSNLKISNLFLLIKTVVMQCNHRREEAMTKTCTKCAKTKNIEEFTRKKGYKDGHRTYCKECIATYERVRTNTPKNKQRAREYELRRRYGMTFNQKMVIFKAQKGRCAICRTLFKCIFSSHVDHNHTTKAIRGLLCSPCNTALGLLKESKKNARNLIRYIQKHE